MTEEMVYAKNEANGVVALVPAHYLEHPILGATLVQVRNGKNRVRLSELGDSTPETPQVPETPEVPLPTPEQDAKASADDKKKED